MAFLGNDHAAKCVWHASAKSNERDAHDCVGYEKRVADDGYHPYHHVGEYREPHERHDEREHVEAPPLGSSTARHGQIESEKNRPAGEVLDLVEHGLLAAWHHEWRDAIERRVVEIAANAIVHARGR